MSFPTIGSSIPPVLTTEDIFRPQEAINRQSGTFRRVLGGVVGGVGNLLLPGVGGLLGSALSGSGVGLSAGPFLAIQEQIQAEARAVELQSTIMKVKHDMCMSCIRNMK
jgi:hypothetical protein